jgi:ADP-heptose:LPS heptosyltransferase
LKKFLIIRFSSIGDIVLTTPIVRCLQQQLPEAEIHFVTKSAFAGILKENPHITKVHAFEKELAEIIPALKAEQFDHIIDLHKNLRSLHLKLALKRPSSSFSKLNVRKYILTKFKINIMPNIHVVDRYFKAVLALGVKNDGKGLDYFIPEQDVIKPADFGIQKKFIAYVIGGQFATKKLPNEKAHELARKISVPVVLIGGKEDLANGQVIAKDLPHVINLCGQLNLNQSASVVAQSTHVITHDTGLMHIAAAFKKPISSIWGNTLPTLGMYPYMPDSEAKQTVHEVDIACRPCSKIGYQTCPKGHFKCMADQDIDAIVAEL